ncbi:hypothetical protein Tsubulata_000802 [Turnera subulata]|uniref:Uncharacterized protein n=1 Tax=Turnera subulata TaxID=218843 RepID=A0A9Q0JM43_9ROSI|nr:hypothetical protein Tsubulata_000802 [Turnera subulata]
MLPLFLMCYLCAAALGKLSLNMSCGRGTAALTFWLNLEPGAQLGCIFGQIHLWAFHCCCLLIPLAWFIYVIDFLLYFMSLPSFSFNFRCTQKKGDNILFCLIRIM